MPGLGAATGTLLSILVTVSQTQNNDARFHGLAETAAQVLSTINVRLQGVQVTSHLESNLKELER